MIEYASCKRWKTVLKFIHIACIREKGVFMCYFIYSFVLNYISTERPVSVELLTSFSKTHPFHPFLLYNTVNYIHKLSAVLHRWGQPKKNHKCRQQPIFRPHMVAPTSNYPFSNRNPTEKWGENTNELLIYAVGTRTKYKTPIRKIKSNICLLLLYNE